jgi:tRNA U38,U39,U40 pseudouridine synthase TruA
VCQGDGEPHSFFINQLILAIHLYIFNASFVAHVVRQYIGMCVLMCKHVITIMLIFI